MKKIFALILAAMMLLTCVPALAGAGDQTIAHSDSNMFYINEYIQNVAAAGDNQLYAFVRGDNTEILRVYSLDNGEHKDFILRDYNSGNDYSLLDYYEITDEGISLKEDAVREISEEERYNTAAWFSWNGSITCTALPGNRSSLTGPFRWNRWADRHRTSGPRTPMPCIRRRSGRDGKTTACSHRSPWRNSA